MKDSTISFARVQLAGDNPFPERRAFFVFDLDSDRCRFFSPSIKRITGFSSKKYLHKGIIYFKNFIHPGDYSGFISELLTYILVSREQKGFGTADIRIPDLSCRIRHKGGNWVPTGFQVMYLTSSSDVKYNILAGIVEELDYHECNYKECTGRLTNREKEVLQLIGNGDSSKIIADKLHISETTAITHRKNLIQKLQVKNTAELIKEAVKAKIIE